MRLANCFAELFAYVGYFLRFAHFKNVPFEEFQANVQRLLKEADTMLYQAKALGRNKVMPKFDLCFREEQGFSENPVPAG